nr:SH3 domain-containing protein [Hephaestia sp. MAHUQ-44]
MARIVLRDATLRESPATDAAPVTDVKAGDAFDLLDTVGGTAWGIATQQGLVGYIEAEALGAGPKESRA